VGDGGCGETGVNLLGEDLLDLDLAGGSLGSVSGLGTLDSGLGWRAARAAAETGSSSWSSRSRGSCLGLWLKVRWRPKHTDTA